MRSANCLGCELVDKGHKRVPAPPDRITGLTAVVTRRGYTSGCLNLCYVHGPLKKMEPT